MEEIKYFLEYLSVGTHFFWFILVLTIVFGGLREIVSAFRRKNK